MRTQIQDVKLDNLLICPGVGKMLLTFEQMVNFLWYRLDNEVLPFGSKIFTDYDICHQAEAYNFLQ